ncbi:MAG: ATP-binding protein [Bryobacteraceae bacterium]|nr:ATP-binding protein [Bryobacteraceae bacterium]MDW8377162.1 ATP-binding protein [Bryobacterales bacterium]
MRSLYAKILVWCVLMTALAGAAFFFINARAVRSRGNPWSRINRFQMEQAILIFHTLGKEGLQEYIERVNQMFGPEHHLLDRHYRDVLTQTDFSEYAQGSLRQWEGEHPPIVRGRVVISRPSPDGQYTWMVIASPREPWNFLPYYGVLLAIIAALLWLLTSRLVVPLRKLAKVMDDFGAGNLSARFKDSRRDEIGSLGNSFNQMADRVQTLLVAERRLLQDVSHELRSPLARLSFAVRLARTAPDRDAALDRVKREVERLTELVSSLIEVTRAEGDPAERPQDTVSLDELLNRVSADCQLDAQSKNCRVSYRGTPAVAVAGNEELLRRAVENVTRNAIRYAPAGTEVEVCMKTTDREAVVEVRDYGPGVPEEKLNRIFDPFFRVEASRDSTEGGVGLGLAIARRAVSVHNGSIRARNMNPGLCVEIRLPLTTNGSLAPSPQA